MCAGELGETQITDVAVGFDGKYKVGYWTPVWLTITGGRQTVRGQLAVTVLDGDGVRTGYAVGNDETLLVPAGKAVRVLRYVKFGRIHGALTAELRTDDGRAARRSFSADQFPMPLLSDRKLIVTIGPSIGVEDALRVSAGASSSVVAPILPEKLAELPDQWYGYEGVNTLILTTSDSETLERVGQHQLEAIHQWLMMGGRLVICVGARGNEVFGPQSRFGKFAPGQLVDVITLRNTAALETYVGASKQLDPGDGVERRGIEMTLLRDVCGVAELDDAGPAGPRPMIVRRPLGFGRLDFVAFDLDQPPFPQWWGRPRLVAKILHAGSAGIERRSREQQNGQVAHVGYTDLVGQLRSALDQFTGIPLVAFFWVFALIFVYIALVGPGDYFFLKNVAGRMQWTWLTFPLIVIAFGGLAVLLNVQLKGNRLRVNQVDLVDVDVESGLVRGTMWAHVYSPRTQAYDFKVIPVLGVDPTAAGTGTLLSWQGLPGTGLGGLNTSARVAVSANPYAIAGRGNAISIVGTPVQVSSTKSLVGRWWGKANLAANTPLMVDANGLLRGDVVNPLPVELSECMVLYDNWAYRLERKQGVLGPGEKARVDLERALNLEWRLTRRQVVESRDVSTPWDQDDLNVPRIVEIMMFHQAARGDDYTQLSHRYQRYVDLSGHLTSGRAILVGRARERASELVAADYHGTDPYDEHWTFCRIVFPVVSGGR